MDIAHILRDILVVLVAAKVAAEVAERIGIPAVVGEIVAGMLVGPSLLGFVGATDDVLRTLGELGVILLLLEVGIEMDLRELSRVGRTSFLVAIVGVAAPMVLGTVLMQAMGQDLNTALFVGAALTATSVGITARVFGDLRALATTEARIVLGAAVADDVMGLVVLTVVVRLVTEGSVSVISVAGIVALAVGFLLLGGLAGLRVAPPLFGLVERISRSTGTLVALALAFTLAFAQLADAAQLAPIVGAFVAGIALSRSAQSERVRRELAPVGHLLIPVFFLQIGIDADIGAFASGSVLLKAGALLVVAVIGKVVAASGAVGSPGDKLLIGLGMLPRGEVGLIFATMGAQSGVLDEELYAALLLVVLATTLAAPQLLKLRYSAVRRGQEPAAESSGTALVDALDAAIVVARQRPSDILLDRLSSLPAGLAWDAGSRERLLDVIERGNARSWRFLASVGILARALPELDAGFRAREGDPFGIDPLQAYRLQSMERLRSLDTDDPLADEIRSVASIDDLLLAALLVEALESVRDPVADARRILRRLSASRATADSVLAAVTDRDLLWSAAHQPGGLSERAVVPLAFHIAHPDQARMHYVLSTLRGEGRERWELIRLRELHSLVQATLTDPQLGRPDARGLEEQRRSEAVALVAADARAAERIRQAPPRFVLQQAPEDLAVLARLLDPVPATRHARVHLDADRIDVVAADRPVCWPPSPARCPPSATTSSMPPSPPGKTASQSSRSASGRPVWPTPASWSPRSSPPSAPPPPRFHCPRPRWTSTSWRRRGTRCARCAPSTFPGCSTRWPPPSQPPGSTCTPPPCEASTAW